MRILMLVNWKVEYAKDIPCDKQPPDYVAEGKPYWFFRYFEKEQGEEIQVDVVDIRSFPFLERFEKNKLRFYIWQTLRVLPKLKQYDLVLSHGMQSGIVLCLWRRLFGKGSYRHIVFDIGAFNSARENGRSLSLMQYASKALDGVIYHTPHQKTYYEKCHPWLLDKAQFITFGTDSEFFQKNTPDYHNDRKSNPEQTGKYILCAGYYKRDWDTLIKAYDQLDTQVKLRLIGNADLKTENPNIEVWGAVPVEEFKKQIEGALFCILPLQQFNYSYGQMTLLQQMAMGKAVIVADVYSIEAYKGEDHFLLYQPENVLQLKKQMERLLNSEELRERIGKTAQQAVEKRYNEKIMAYHIQRVLDQWMKRTYD
jgi:glycosyltransferase involved in cell wall biosynthesis